MLSISSSFAAITSVRLVDVSGNTKYLKYDGNSSSYTDSGVNPNIYLEICGDSSIVNKYVGFVYEVGGTYKQVNSYIGGIFGNLIRIQSENASNCAKVDVDFSSSRAYYPAIPDVIYSADNTLDAGDTFIVLSNTTGWLNGSYVVTTEGNSTHVNLTVVEVHDQDGNNITTNKTYLVVGISNGTSILDSGITYLNGTVTLDRAGYSGVITIFINGINAGLINTAPNTTIPTIDPITAYTDSDLYCNATLTDTEDSSLTAYWVWYKDDAVNMSGSISVSNGTNANITVLLSGDITKDETWICEVTPSDGNMNGTAKNSTGKLITNSAPTLGSTSVATDPIKGGAQQIITAVSPGDIDDDNLNFYCCNDTSDSCTPTAANNVCSYSGTWLSPYTGMNCTYNVPLFGYETIYVRCSTYDGTDYSAVASNSFVEDDNTPSITFYTPPTPLDGTRNTGNSVTIKVNVTNNLTIDMCIIEFDGNNYTMTEDGSGKSINCSYTNSSLIDGTTYSYKVFANDSVNNLAVSGSRNFTENGLPVSTTPVVTPASPITTDDLNCNATLTDTEDNTLIANWTWYKNGAVNSTGQTVGITSGTNSIIATLLAANTTKGENWSCSVIPYDDYEYGTLKMSANVTIQNIAPTISQQLQFVNATAGHSFNVSARVNDSDGVLDIIDSNISSTSGSCIRIVFVTIGDEVEVVYNCTGTALQSTTIQISFNDSSSAYATTTADSNTYPNNIPSITGVNITPDPAYTTDDLNCTVSGGSDLDGDAVYYYYNWSNGIITLVHYSALSIDILLYGNTSAGETWTCNVTPTDTVENGTSLADSVTISSKTLNVTVLINGAETTAFGNSGEPYNVTVIVKDNSTGNPVENATVKIVETNGYTPFTQPQYEESNVSNHVYGAVNTSSSGTVMLTAIPTGGRYVLNSEVGPYNITVNVTASGYNNFTKEFTVTHNDFPTPDAAINIPNKNNIEAFNLEVYRIYSNAKGWLLLGGGVNYSVTVYTNGTAVGMPTQLISGKPTGFNITVLNHTSLEPIINAAVEAEEQNGYPPFVLPQHSDTNIPNYAVGETKTDAAGTTQFTVIPTGGRYIQSGLIGAYNATIRVYNNDSSLVYTNTIDVDNTLPVPSGAAYGVYNSHNIESFNLELYRIYANVKGWLIY